MSSPMLSPQSSHYRVRIAVIRLSHRISLAALIGTLAFSTLSTLSINARAAENPLTLADAQQLAIERSRQLAAQDFAITAAREMAVAAGQLPDPVLNIGVSNLPISGPNGFSLTNEAMTTRRIGLMQKITRADKRQLRADRFEREAEKTFTEKNMTAAAIERDTALAWIDRYYAEAMAAVVAEQGEQARLEIESSEGAYRAGRGNQAKVFAARSALAAFDNRSSEAQRRVRNAKTMLARWIGSAADVPLAGKPATDSIRLDPAALDTRLTQLPEVAVFDMREKIAATEVKLAQANKKSDWSVEFAFQQRGPSYANQVSFGVSIPLQWDQKNRQDRELSAKLALVEQARAERDEMLRSYVAKTRNMINDWENNRERHARFERELIPLANARTDAALTAYRGGKASLVEVLSARSNEIDVRIQALQLATDTDRLWAQINFLFPADATVAHAALNSNQDVK
ncbi:MAG: TolC family protein [Burkholderiaceae bacterium]